MTLEEAFAAMIKQKDHDDLLPTTEVAEHILVNAGYCPECAGEGERWKLGPWEMGDRHRHSGRECQCCEFFWKCGEQPEYSPDTACDADKGL